MSDKKNVVAETKPEITKAPSDLLGTKVIHLSRSQRIKAVNLLLPPGISTFYVEYVGKNKIRFLVRSSEIMRLANKSSKLKEAVESKTAKETKN